jgi:outer membrane protein TolC
MKSAEVLLSLTLLVAAGPAPAADDPSPIPTPAPLALDWVVTQVLSNNPALKAAADNWQAMRLRIPQARAWADPRASFDQRVARFVGVPPNSFNDEKLMVEQTLPLSGRHQWRGNAATAEAAGALEESRRKALDAVARARAAYFSLANASKQLELNRRNSNLLKQFVEITRAQLTAGNASQAAVLSAETTLARLDEAQFDFERDIAEARTALNVLMNRPPDAPLPRPPEPDFSPVALSLATLEGLALANRPELAIAQRKIDAAEARLREARNQRIPDPSFRVEADRYNGAGQVVSELDAGLSIDLPWFNRSKYRAAIAENERLVEAARHELDAERAVTLGLVADQFHQVETYHHHTELYQAKLMPLAQQSVEAERAGYESNKGGYLEILTAQGTVRDIESSYWDHLMHYQTALATLESIIGVDLPEASTGGASSHHHPEQRRTP